MEEGEEMQPMRYEPGGKGRGGPQQTQLTPQQWLKNNTRLVAIVGVAVLLVVAAVAVVLGVFLSAPSPEPDAGDPGMYDWIIEEVETDESGVKLDCSGDSFQELKFQTKSGVGIYLKYLIVKSLPEGGPLNFGAVFDHCRSVNSSLWEVVQGEPEWKAMLAKLKAANALDIWLNGRVVGDCPGADFQCRDAEAAKGIGIGVRWPSYPDASYSRQHRRPSSNRNCMVVVSEEPHLWETDLCNIGNHPGVCIKRNCKPVL